MITVKISPLASDGPVEYHRVIFTCVTCGATWSVAKEGTFYVPHESFCLFCQETHKVKIIE